MAESGFFEKQGKVSLWLGVRKPDVGAMEGVDILKDLCGVVHYDVDDQEVAGADKTFPQAPVSDLLSQFSYASSFLAPALQAADIKKLPTAYWALAQYDFAYDAERAAGKVAPDPLFLGVFDWDDSEDE